MLAALVAAATAAVYTPVARHDFINYDDGDYVVQNAHVHEGLTFETATWALTTMATGNWHPVTWISHATDYQLFGLDPTGHHVMSLLLHVLNVLVLAWLLASMTSAPGRSLMVAALFALHPLNVESVAWVAERKNVLSTLFFLLAIAAYVRYTQKSTWQRYGLMLVSFGLGLAAKPMVVTLPFVLLLLDYWPLQRIRSWSAASEAFPVTQVSFSRCLAAKLPLFVLSAASCAITVIAQRSSGAVRTLGAFSLHSRVENAAYAYVRYLWKAAFPARLAVFYPHPGLTLGAWSVVASLLFLTAMTWTAWRARSRAPYLTVGWFWFLGTMVPVIGLVQVGAQAMADRYAYVPLVGIFIALVWGITDLGAKFSIDSRWLAATSVILLAAFSGITWKQLSFWHDSYSAWSHALAVTPDNPVAESQLGMALMAAGREEDAMQHFQTAISLGTQDPTSYLNLGAYLNEHGRQKEAIPVLEAAVRINKDRENSVLTQLNLGFAYTSLGDYQNARLHYRASLQIDRERVAVTIRDLAAFVASHPSARDYMKLALLREQAGERPEAEAAYLRVLALDSRVDEARSALAAHKSDSP